MTSDLGTGAGALVESAVTGLPASDCVTPVANATLPATVNTQATINVHIMTFIRFPLPRPVLSSLQRGLQIVGQATQLENLRHRLRNSRKPILIAGMADDAFGKVDRDLITLGNRLV